MNGRMRRTFVPLVLGAVLAAGSAASAWGVLTPFWESGRRISTGGIDISVKAWTEDDGHRKDAAAATVIDAEKMVSYVPQVENKADKAYVRVSLSADAGAEGVDLTEHICGVKEDWKKIGGYMYCTKVMSAGDMLDVCDGFTVPEEWDYMKSREMAVRISADAIQAEGFRPDFDSEEPWGEVSITDSKETGGHLVSEAVSGKRQGVRVICDEAAGICVGTDGFSDLTCLMPGDTKTGVITVRNDNREDVKLFFKTEWEGDDLSKVMRMRVDNGATVYSGTVAGGSFSSYRPVADLKAGEEKDIAVMMSLPPEADNRYSFQESCQTWYFAVEDEAVGTGDGSTVLWAAAVCLVSGISVICAVKMKRKRDEEL